MVGKKEEGGLNHLYTLMSQHETDGEKAFLRPRITGEYSTGDSMIDEYIGGGYGREGGYEIVMVYGSTGVNKSTFATQMILRPALAGKRVCYFSLEDDVDDLYCRMRLQIKSLGSKFDNPIEAMRNIGKNIMVAPESDGYTLGAMSGEVEAMFRMGCDIIVVDPLQFIFEASVVEKTETEFNRQRLFMRQINNLIKRVVRETGKSKTIILVSHTNKGKWDDPLDSIMGSGANKQVPTKIIQISRDDSGNRFLRLNKTRFTQHRFGPHPIELDKETMTIHTLSTPSGQTSASWAAEVRRCWGLKGK